MEFRQLLNTGRKTGASDIHLVAGAPPAFRIDGEIELAKHDALTPAEIATLILPITTTEQRDQLQRERELSFSMVDEEFGRARVTLYYHGGQPEVAVRLCEERVRSLEELHLPPSVDGLSWLTSGMVIITGSTGMGKTTTMNYMIDRINSERRCKIITIEDPVEYTHRHKRSIVVQQEVHSDTHSFYRALVHALRQDPDVIAIGEMRDLETMSTALTAAETGHLVLATLHTSDTVQTVERVVGVFPVYQQNYVQVQFANTLQAAIAQKLLPVASGKGRVLATEVLVATTAVRHVIREGEHHQLYTILQTGTSQNMHTMDASLLDLYQKGLITYDVALNNARHPDFIESRAGRRQPISPSTGSGPGGPSRG
jgi:twitching motility protein PilT